MNDSVDNTNRNIPDILILGVGNFLMGDEGVGVHAVKMLEKENLPQRVELLDGGTGGFHLMGHLESHPIVIMIDATMDGNPTGTISLIKPRFASDFPDALSAHDIGLKDMIESLIIMDKLPEIHLFTVSIESIQPMQITLSKEIEAALPNIKKEVLALVEKFISLPA